MTEGDHYMHETVPVDTILRAWTDIASQPDKLTNMREKKTLFAAGGGLPLQFGNAESEIWQSIQEVAVEGKVAIAGVTRSLVQLEQMGSFYRFLKGKGYTFHCIDERLADDLDHLHHQVHKDCGACNATGTTTRMADVEGVLLRELNEDSKQPVYEDMHHHKSLVISVGLKDSLVAEGDLRMELKEKGALEFDASIPLDLINDWASEYPDEHVFQLVESLVLWNVQIARNIIGGDHNEFSNQADETIIVLNSTGIESNSFYATARGAIEQVPHRTLLEIK